MTPAQRDAARIAAGMGDSPFARWKGSIFLSPIRGGIAGALLVLSTTLVAAAVGWGVYRISGGALSVFHVQRVFLPVVWFTLPSLLVAILFFELAAPGFFLIHAALHRSHADAPREDVG